MVGRKSGSFLKAGYFELDNRLSTAYQNIPLFIINPEVFISLGEGKHIDFGTTTKDLKES